MKKMDFGEWHARVKPLLLTLLFVLLPFAVQAQTESEAKALHEAGRKYLEEGEIAKGREYTRKAMEMRKNLFGEENEDYIVSLSNYAISFSMEDDYHKAVELQEQVMNLCSRLETPHPNLTAFRINMGRFYYLDGNMAGAAGYWEQALPMVEKYGEEYELILTGLGAAYSELNDVKGLDRVLALMEEHNRHELQKECNEPGCMVERAQYFATIGDNAQAKDCFLKALAMQMTDEERVKTYMAYADFLSGTGDFITASEYYISAANVIENSKLPKTDYANVVYKAGVYSYLGGAYCQAVDLYQTAIDFLTQQDSEEAEKKETDCYKGMGNAYSAIKEYEEAVDCFKRVVEYYGVNGRSSEEYSKALLNLGKAEKFAGRFDEAIEHHKQAMSIFEKMNMAEQYSDAASSLQLCYAYSGRQEDMDMKEGFAETGRIDKLNRIIEDELNDLELYRKYLGGLAYARSLSVIAGCYALKEDYDSAVDYYKRYMSSIRAAVRDEFRLQSESERMLTWQDEAMTMQQLKELLVMIPETDMLYGSELGALLYDEELLSKGILLKSAIEFENILDRKEDKELMAIYRQSKDNEKELQRLRRSVTSEADLEKILLLSQENQALSLRLYKECMEFADFTDYISYGWRDVQKELGNTDVAIEFADIKISPFDTDNLMIALVLTSEMKVPAIVRVCNLEEAKSMEADDSLFGVRQNVVWEALKQYIDGRRRIFFSADDCFNRIGIEYLPYNGVSLSEQFEVYRLSSTKELCYRHPEIRVRKAALFGDINYNDMLVTTSNIETNNEDGQRISGGDGIFADLSNTLKEIDGIYDLLKSHNINDVQRFTDVKASKTNFKRLTDSDINLLHIATHGVYKEKSGSTDEESMLNSQLAFAGANLGDEGIVTAADVSVMNLRECDLVVLSACETGLGKLGDDGVFGLQRGFKNSGVHTLLISLQKVYDKATAELMNLFYKNLMEGLPKRESLIKAQQELRSKGYEDPKYWATFILLDAY